MAVLPEEVPGQERILTSDAQEFVRRLVRRFRADRDALLARRVERQRAFRAGELPDFLSETASIRAADWSVAPAPADLDDRRVEITGPTDAKMMINALNSGASVFMADFEDALSPPWGNVIGGQLNCLEAIRGTLRFRSPEGKEYRLDPSTATLVVRPRGWHLEEAHFAVDDRPAPASLFDFGLYFFHNVRELLARGSGPYFYLPKLESHLEARLWNQVFEEAQDALGIPQGTIRATVLIETLVAAFEMDEILYEPPRGGAQCRPLGLHLQHHQEAGPSLRVHPARPGAGHHVGPLHGGLYGAAGADLSPAAGSRHRRHGRVHSLAPGPGGESPGARAGA
jgi:malate synthase